MSDTNSDNITPKPLVNRVAQSGLITIDLEKLSNSQEILELDIKDFLVSEFLLKEKEFRANLDDFDWENYSDKIVAVHCSTDALLQQWAFMLITSKLKNVAKNVYFGNRKQVVNKHLIHTIQQLKLDDYAEKRVIIKGCSKEGVSDEAYLEITKILQPVVKSLMFGEACSTVPIYKAPK